MARRLAALLLLGPELDTHYAAVYVTLVTLPRDQCDRAATCSAKSATYASGRAGN